MFDLFFLCKSGLSLCVASCAQLSIVVVTLFDNNCKSVPLETTGSVTDNFTQRTEHEQNINQLPRSVRLCQTVAIKRSHRFGLHRKSLPAYPRIPMAALLRPHAATRPKTVPKVSGRIKNLPCFTLASLAYEKGINFLGRPTGAR